MIKNYILIYLLNINFTSQIKKSKIFEINKNQNENIVNEFIKLTCNKNQKQIKKILLDDYEKFLEVLEIYYKIFEENQNPNENFYKANILREKEFENKIKEKNIALSKEKLIIMKFMVIPSFIYLLKNHNNKKDFIYSINIDNEEFILEKNYFNNFNKILYVNYFSTYFSSLMLKQIINPKDVNEKEIPKFFEKLQKECFIKKETITFNNINNVQPFNIKKIKEKYSNDKDFNELLENFSEEEKKIMFQDDNIYKLFEFFENYLNIFFKYESKWNDNMFLEIFTELKKFQNNKFFHRQILWVCANMASGFFTVFNLKKENNGFYAYSFFNNTGVKYKIHENYIKATIIHGVLSTILNIIYNKKLTNMSELRFNKLNGIIHGYRSKIISSPNMFVEVEKTTF